MSRSLILLILMVGISIVFSQLFFVQLESQQALSPLTRLATSYRVYSEFLLAAGLVVVLVNGPAWSRALGYSIFVLFTLTYVVQFVSIYLTGAFLTPTALENIEHLGLIVNGSKLLAAGAITGLLLLFVLMAELRFRPGRTLVVAFAGAGCLLGAAVLELDRYWLSEDIQAERFTLYHFANNYMADSAPLRALVRSASIPYQAGQPLQPLSESELKTAAEFGVAYQADHPYPLLRGDFYRWELPFRPTPGRAATDRPLNVIVIMSEGISSRVIQPYSKSYPGLTPNIDHFSQSAMRVDNYYNHTFATYRGLLGQLCSIYPFHGGGFISYRADYYCLGKLFNDEGYTTHFLFSQQKKRTQLDEILAKANFQHVLAQNDLREAYLDGEAEKRYLALSDQQLFEALIGHLQSLEQQDHGESPPFFLGVYNIETHAWFEMSEDGVKYPGGESYVLDALHNFDHAFGRFWNFFQQSELRDNTIVIFTSDHAHFQGKDFRALVSEQEDYQPYFVDAIPLLIYHPGLDLPAGFDARYASTIDFAPTVAHLMQFENRPNAFLGRSLFERDGNESLAFGDGNLYLIGPNGISLRTADPQQAGNDSRIDQMYKIIQNIHALESQGRIWNPQHGENARGPELP